MADIRKFQVGDTVYSPQMGMCGVIDGELLASGAYPVQWNEGHRTAEYPDTLVYVAVENMPAITPTLRDQFAMAVIPAIITSPIFMSGITSTMHDANIPDSALSSSIAKVAYDFADAMLKVREKK